jgi:hypothetical protein
MALETRIALIGVGGALLGTLVGGGVTYAVTQSQISSQKAESRRTERLDAYSTYFGDSEKFWVDVQTITREGLHPKAVTAAQRADLNVFGETLIGDYARVVLLAPLHVRDAATQLEAANVAVWNALAGGSIEYRRYAQLAREVILKKGLLKQFADAMREDLGTP